MFKKDMAYEAADAQGQLPLVLQGGADEVVVVFFSALAEEYPSAYQPPPFN